jgi:glucosylceramidase
VKPMLRPSAPERGLRLVCPLAVCAAVSCSSETVEAPQVPAPSVPAPAPEPTLVISGPGDYFREATPLEVRETPEQLVDEAVALQEWHGFGGTFNEAGWDALLAVDEPARQHALELLFHPRRGARFSYGRIPIGASDYAIDRYTLSEVPDDYAMVEFSIERDRERLIPFIKAALAVEGGLHLWASPWTPPAWMKENDSTDGGRIRDEPEVLEAYALYLSRFIEAYGAEGIAVEAIQPQNEPGYEQTYPTCLWTPELLRDFVGLHLGPTLAERGLSTQLWFGTMSAPEDVQHVAAVMEDDIAAQYVRGIGVQWNMLSAVPEFAASYGLPIMQTEHRCGNYPWQKASFNASRAPNDHAYAEETWGLIASWVRAGVNSYLSWNMVLDSVGLNLDVERAWPQNALLAVDRRTQSVTVTPAYYVFRHLSQFVDPGARRLGTSGDADALAFENPDGTIVTVLYNSADGARDTTLGIRGTTLRFTIPAHGWATVNWR